MNTSNPETPPENPPVAAPPNDNRRRLRDLLSIPERDRTDEQWDEIIELEIQLAPGNRISGNEPSGTPVAAPCPTASPVAAVVAAPASRRRSIVRAPTTITVVRARTSRPPAEIPPDRFVRFR